MRSLIFSSQRITVNNHRTVPSIDRLTSSSTCASASLDNVLRTPFQVQTSRFNSPSLSTHAQTVAISKSPSSSSFPINVPFYTPKDEQQNNTLEPAVTPAKPAFPHHWSSQHLPQALQVVHEMLISHGKGSFLFDVQGNKFLDFMSGIGVTNLGHCHPAVDQAVMKQVSLGSHFQMGCVSSLPSLSLAAALAARLPPSLSQVHFANSGAESIENAIKLARHATGRTNIIVMQGGFHGRTIAAGSLTTAKYMYRAGFQPMMSGVFVTPYPYCVQCPCSKQQPEKFNKANCCNEPIAQLKQLLIQQSGPTETAAILVEPVLGEGGYVVPPKSYIHSLRKICDEIGALLICDEVQSGFGRTGTLYAFEQFGVTPDILVTAKGLANGYPLSAIISSPEIFAKAKPGSIGGTYGGNPVSCSAALAVLQSFDQEKTFDNVKARSEQLVNGLLSFKQRGFPVLDVRGLGLMIGVEFGGTGSSQGVASKMVKACAREGLLLLSTGIHETIRFIPPLNISKEEMALALQAFERALIKTFPNVKA